MKSEKVKKFIRDKQVYMLDPRFVGYREVKALGRNNSYRAVELAEQEAEERMREKALSAFDDMWFEIGEDGEFGPDYKYYRRNFIQRLNEE